MKRGPSDHAGLLVEFVNTRDLDRDTDRLDSPAALGTWLHEHGLAGSRARATAADVADAVRLREALRGALRDRHDGVDEHPDLDAALAGYRLRVVVDDGRPRAEAVDTGARAGLGAIAAALVGAVGDGTWERLKVCAEGTCQWAFLDATKNRSRTWCSMGECGGRAKSRAYRARRRARVATP